MPKSKRARALDAGGLRAASRQRLRRGRGPFGNIASACPRRSPHAPAACPSIAPWMQGVHFSFGV